MTDPCVHIWNAHRQCQWCKRDRKDVEYDEMKAEIDRLRGLLREACQMLDDDVQLKEPRWYGWYDEVTAALEGKQ